MRILVIEDDRRLASILRRALGEAGMAVDIAEDGEEGIAAATTTEFDVIVMDVMLPVLDGVAATRRLRDGRIRTPVLMLRTCAPPSLAVPRSANYVLAHSTHGRPTNACPSCPQRWRAATRLFFAGELFAAFAIGIE